jgi:hypothetical protein
LRTSKSWGVKSRTKPRLDDDTASALKLCRFGRREMKGQETQGGKGREGKVLHKPSPYRRSVFPKHLECQDACVIDGRWVLLLAVMLEMEFCCFLVVMNRV